MTALVLQISITSFQMCRRQSLKKFVRCDESPQCDLRHSSYPWCDNGSFQPRT